MSEVPGPLRSGLVRIVQKAGKSVAKKHKTMADSEGVPEGAMGGVVQ